MEKLKQEIKGEICLLCNHRKSCMDQCEILLKLPQIICNLLQRDYVPKWKKCPKCKWERGYFVDTNGEICKDCDGLGHVLDAVQLAENQEVQPVEWVDKPDSIGWWWLKLYQKSDRLEPHYFDKMPNCSYLKRTYPQGKWLKIVEPKE